MGDGRAPLPTRVEDTPTLPAAYDIALRDGLADLGLDLDDQARAAIDGHLRLLLAWTPAINLTALRDPAAVATGHAVDALSAVGVLRVRGLDRFLDLGSGGGVPGLPLAAALPAAEAVLLEPIGKKARFLETAVAAAGMADRVRVVAARAEDLARDPRERGRWPAITARAVASLAELVELAFPLLAVGGVLIAWKRGDLAAELADARLAVAALGGGDLATHDPGVRALPGHRLVLATRRGSVPAGYPRDPSVRRRRPFATLPDDARRRPLGHP